MATKTKSPNDQLIKDFLKLLTDYENHGDSLKWFRSRKLKLLEEKGFKTKEEKDKCLEQLKKEIGIGHKLRPYL